MERHLRFPKLGKLLEESRSRKEIWFWDGVIPAKDLTLIAAFMKKGKTTLLTGVVNGLLKTGSYCGRGVQAGRKVLYLAPEEGDTLIRRLERLGFGEEDEPSIVVIPRGHGAWAQLVSAYRMREWASVIKELKEDGFDTIILDGLHTLLMMFEPMAKEDNESVGKFMAQFVLPFGSEFTVIASLHTKKGGGDPRMKVPPEEMIRGASAWMAHPGQILVMEHDRRTDTKTFHAFGRYEGSTANGWSVRYDLEKRDYVGWGDEEEREQLDDIARIKLDRERAALQAAVLATLTGGAKLTGRQIQDLVGGKRAKVIAIVGELQASGDLLLTTEKVPTGHLRQVYQLANPKSGISGGPATAAEDDEGEAQVDVEP